MSKYLPYFWDYKITEKDLKSILASRDEIKRRWAMARLVESAPLSEIWNHIGLKELQEVFPRLKLKEPVRRVWQKALEVWSH